MLFKLYSQPELIGILCLTGSLSLFFHICVILFISIKTKCSQTVSRPTRILVECPNFGDIREKYFTVSSLADLFNRVDNHTVIDFIKETHFTTNCNLC